MNRWQEGNNYFTHYDSFSEAMTLATSQDGKLPRNVMECASEDEKGESGRYEWDYQAGWKGACRLLAEGWPEGLALVGKVAAIVSSRTSRALKKVGVAYDVAGDFVDVGRFCAGDPENMGSFRIPKMRTGRVVRIVASTGATSLYGADAMKRRGAAAVALVDALESCGRQCEVIADTTCEDGNKLHEIRYPVKMAGERIELDRLAFVLAHPAQHRRLNFSLKEHEPKAIRRLFNFHDGYGRSVTPRDDGSGAIIVPELSGLRSDADAIAWVFSQLRAQGIEVNE